MYISVIIFVFINNCPPFTKYELKRESFALLSWSGFNSVEIGLVSQKLQEFVPLARFEMNTHGVSF